MHKNFLFALSTAAVAVLLLTSCSDSPTAAPVEAKSQDVATPAQPVPAKTAFWEMYKSARLWAQDNEALSLQSKDVPGFKNAGGNAAQWVGIFGSPSLHQAITFTYTVASVPPDIKKGVSVGRSIPWSGPQRQAMPFDTGEFKTDSDAAFKSALADAKPWLDKHPDDTFSMSLGNASRFSGPVWSCQWGTPKDGYLAYVNATTSAIEHPKK
jgi:hypothetical protein